MLKRQGQREFSVLILVLFLLLCVSIPKSSQLGISASLGTHICQQHQSLVESGEIQPPLNSSPTLEGPENDTKCGWYFGRECENRVHCKTFEFKDEDCGENAGAFSPKIVGGHPAAPGKWPWQASIQSGERGHYCGGTLISETAVLTAAHCVKGVYPGDIKVVLGINKRSESAQGQNIRVSKINVHPKFSQDGGLANDIAVIILASPANVTANNVKFISMPKPNEPPVGDRCYITGWGAQDPEGLAALPDELQEVVLNVIDNARCKEMTEKDPELPPLEEDMICFVGGGDQTYEGHCTGDSGGPAVCLGGKRAYIVGVTSWSQRPCGQAEFPSVDSRVTYHLEWIGKNMI